jgi:hypothetical protein
MNAHELALRMIRDAIQGTTPLGGVPNQRFSDQAPDGLPGDNYGRWMLGLSTQRSTDDQLMWRREIWVVQLVGVWSLADQGVAELGRVATDASKVAHAISKLTHAQQSATDGTPCLFQPQQMQWVLDQGIAQCTFEVNIDIEMVR